MDKLAARYGMADHPVIKQMQKMLENLTVKSASVY
jgi:hypothetical protein